jgi:riboflavin biosynthesis pyrimidine reductase
MSVQAESAPLTVARLAPHPTGPVELDTDNGRAFLAQAYAPLARRFVRINMIASLNGSAVGEDGTSESLSNRVDRRILGVIREAADVVVVGARTVRREGYLGPSSSRLAIVTLSGDLTGHRLQKSPTPPIVLCPASAADRVHEQLVDIPHQVGLLDSPALDAREVLALLTGYGLTSVVCEGGPTLAAAFLEDELVDELCLTVSARLRSPGVPLLARLSGAPTTTLQQLLLDGDSTLYGRWAIDR